jgi:subtilisin-like proprotein convertase family protein
LGFSVFLLGSANFAAFNGENASGSWTLCVGDSASADTGTLQTWSLRIAAIEFKVYLPLIIR